MKPGRPHRKMNNALYSVRDLRFSYEAGKRVLTDCALELRQGDFLGLIGPNGAGKSTLLYLLTRWLRADSGSISLNGKAIDQWKRADIARQVAVVPQREDGAFAFTVEEVVLMGRYIHRVSPFGFESDEDHDAARRAIELAELKGFEHRRASTLSGGEFQRLLIARALAQETPVMLLDEPTASLDLAHQRQVFTLLEELNRTRGTTILSVSHDINLSALYCHELGLMHEGQIVQRGAPADVLTEETLTRIYNAPVFVGEGPDKRVSVWLRK